MIYFLTFALFFIILTINTIIKKKKLLPNYTGDKHQRFVEKQRIPLSGGIFIVSVFFIIFYKDYVFCITLSLIFILGFFSDIKYLKSPKYRFLFQFLIIFFFVYFSNLQIYPTRVLFLDLALENIWISYFFSIFCILIAINGTNFIDGLNGLALGYYLIISIIIFKLGFSIQPDIFNNQIIFLIIFLAFLFLLNLLNQFYIGDSGAYSLGFIFSFLLISFYLFNNNISPFFIVLLLWYPCFENLFSILRKYKFKRSPIVPDEKHLHQLLFFFISKKLKLKNIYLNNLSSCLINFYNLIIFSLASVYIHHTQYQIMLILFNIILYIVVYLKLFNFKYLKN
jgi:UDP-N-acetylmuramyl pentapeptide phosphotransferase/UDP-N-acetylglucosamine-1-phosphate transferase